MLKYEVTNGRKKKKWDHHQLSPKNVIGNIGPGFHNRCIAAKNKTKALNCAALQLYQVQNSREET